MSGQEEHHASNASAKTQTRAGILTPASDNSLNLSDDTSSRVKKRKRDGNTMEDLLKDTFVVRVSEAILSKNNLLTIKALPLNCLLQATDTATSDAVASIPITTIVPRCCIICKDFGTITFVRDARQDIGIGRSNGKPAYGAHCKI
jgi:hypothetical protein